MKKLYTTGLTVLAMGVTSMSFAQSQRLVLVDHFTQASCGPCASQNPTLQATLDANAGTVIDVKHQVSWPGSDPMNAHYPAGPEDRRQYYGVTGVPNTCLDGGAPGAPNTVVTNATISARAAVPSPFDVSVSHTVSGGSIDVTVDVSCTQAVTGGDMRVFIAVVEREIAFASAPGSNGETEFHNVLKQYLGGTSGTDVAEVWNNGDSQTLTESWTLSNVYDDNQLSVVAWVQDLTGGEVHQAGYSPPVAANALDASAFGIMDVPAEVCTGSVSPTLILSNAGGNDLTSCVITYDVNGGTPETFNWTGSLPFLSNENVTLPAINFTPQANNTLNITVSSPNGSADQNASNDVQSVQFGEANMGSANCTLTIVPDNYGSEITWEVKDGSGTTVYSGGPYTDGQTTPEVTQMTLNADCYEFIINDGYGDGICCAWGNGSYTIESQGNTLITGGEYTDMEERLFKSDGTTGIEETSIVNNFNVFPNPTADIANVNMTLSEDADVVVEVFNAMGQVVYTADKGALQSGAHTFVLDFDNLDSGIYFVNVTAGDSKISKRVTNIK